MKLKKNANDNLKNQSKIVISGLEKIKNMKIRIFKFDSATKIKNFVYSPDQSTQVVALLDLQSYYIQKYHQPSYALLPNGSINNVFFEAPLDYSNLHNYIDDSIFALVNDQIHVFGGYYYINGHNRVIKTFQ